jgi:hypothetical protein
MASDRRIEILWRTWRDAPSRTAVLVEGIAVSPFTRFLIVQRTATGTTTIRTVPSPQATTTTSSTGPAPPPVPVLPAAAPHDAAFPIRPTTVSWSSIPSAGFQILRTPEYP